MASFKAHNHTAHGYATARATIETDHAHGHIDGRGVQHKTAMCKLCVAEEIENRAALAFMDHGLAR